jgi:hypothetical protein
MAPSGKRQRFVVRAATRLASLARLRDGEIFSRVPNLLLRDTRQ